CRSYIASSSAGPGRVLGPPPGASSMKYGLPKYVLLAIGAILLLMASASVGATGTVAAPLTAITDTVEPATRTPTSGPTNTPGPTATPGPQPAKTPPPK